MSEFTKTPGWLDWYAGPSKPRFQVPAGAVDAHCHVFGPAARFPFAANRSYRVPDIGPADTTKYITKTLPDGIIAII